MTAALDRDTDEADNAEGGFAKRPAHSFRIGGVQASIWRNQGDNGDFYNATFETSYQKDGEWKSGKGYGVIDLLCLSKAADMANTWICCGAKPRVRQRNFDRSLSRLRAIDLRGNHRCDSWWRGIRLDGRRQYPRNGFRRELHRQWRCGMGR